MRKVWKKLWAAGVAAALSVCMVFPAMAGQWKQLEGGEFWQWRYEEEDGSYTVNNWQEIDGKWYHFDENGYLDVGWKFLDNTWYYMEKSGEMVTNRSLDGGHMDASGAWVSDRIPPDNYFVSTEEDDAYWPVRQAQYGINSDSYVNNGDGTYTLTYAYDADTVLPALYDVIYATATYKFNGFNYSWKAGSGVFTMTLSDVGYY